MGRKILFKAKRLDNGEWVEGYYYKECDNTYIIEDRQKHSMLNRNEAALVDPVTVCQFTGLKDKDGKEIWEHDLVKFHDVTREVIFQNGAFSLEGCALYKTDIGKAEIVGNKFDRKDGEK